MSVVKSDGWFTLRTAIEFLDVWAFSVGWHFESNGYAREQVVLLGSIRGIVVDLALPVPSDDVVGKTAAKFHFEPCFPSVRRLG